TRFLCPGVRYYSLRCGDPRGVRAMEAKRQTPLWLFGALLAWSVTSAPLQAADATNDLEFRVKAAYLFNFLSFVDYPETALSPASGRTICVLGDDRSVPRWMRPPGC